MIGKDRRPADLNETLPNGNSGNLGNGSASVNIVSAGTVIEGKLNCSGDIRVDGKVIGQIHSKSKVVIGTSGEVEGDIVCQHADIFGKYNGNMQISEILFMKSSCDVKGDIRTGKLVVESGAVFTGHCNMGKSPAGTAGSGTANAGTSTTGTSQTGAATAPGRVDKAHEGRKEGEQKGISA